MKGSVTISQMSCYTVVYRGVVLYVDLQVKLKQAFPFFYSSPLDLSWMIIWVSNITQKIVIQVVDLLVRWV